MNRSVAEVEMVEVCSKIGVGLAMAVTPYVAATGVKLIRNQNIRPNRFDDSSVIFLDPIFAASQSAKTIRYGDVVVVRTGANIGDACVVPLSFDGSQSFTTLVARPNKKYLSAHYLAQYINSSLGRAEVERLMAGGGKGNLNSGELERFRIKLPLVEEQEQIAKILSAWDEAAETAMHFMVARKHRHDWLLRFLISSGNARKHWDTIELGRVIAERSEKTTTQDQYPVLTSSRRGLFLQSEYFSKQVTASENTDYKVMRRGDFTFRSMSDDGRFTFNRLTTLDVGIVSPAYGVFHATDCSPEFLAHFLNSPYFASALRRESQGGTRKALRFSAISQLQIDFPRRAEQRQIASILDCSRQAIDAGSRHLKLLQMQKRGLMQRLLTGEWRVKMPETRVA